MIKVLAKEIVSYDEIKKYFPEEIFKFRQWDDHFHKRLITERELFYAKSSSFKDPDDCKSMVRYDLLNREEKLHFAITKVKERYPGRNRDFYLREAKDGLKNSPLGNPIQVEQLKLRHYQDFDKQSGIISFAANLDNEHLWNEYADKHKGFCVGFNPKILFQVFGGGGIVNYLPRLPIIKPTPFHSYETQSILQIFSKLEKWQDEKEYRIWTISERELTEMDRKVFAPADSFTRIIFGKHMTESSKQEIRESLNAELIGIPLIHL
jgi:hypothetical protein